MNSKRVRLLLVTASLAGLLLATAAIAQPTGGTVILDEPQFVDPMNDKLDQILEKLDQVIESQAKPSPTTPDEPVEPPTPDAPDAPDTITGPIIRVPSGGDIASAHRQLQDGRGGSVLLEPGGEYWMGTITVNKSGASAQAPHLIGVDGDGPRPVVYTTDRYGFSSDFNDHAQHVRFEGIDFVPLNRDPRPRNFDEAAMTADDWNASAIRFLGGDEDITVEDCRFAFYKFAMVFQSNEANGYIRDITLHRNIVVDSYGHWKGDIAGHSSGVFFKYADNLVITENLFDHNGHHASIAGADPTKFNHNLYLQYDCTGNTTVRGNLIFRGAAHGLQLRAGGVVEDNLFVRNPLAMFTGRNASEVINNVVLQSTDLAPGNDNRRGHGIEILPSLDAKVEGNIISQQLGTLPSAYAIQFSWDRNYIDWLDGRDATGTLKDNKVYRWPREGGGSTLAVKFGDIEQADNAIDDPAWIDPGRDVGSYAASIGIDGGFEGFAQAARNRERGEWPVELSASAVNAWVRGGFEAR